MEKQSSKEILDNLVAEWDSLPYQQKLAIRKILIKAQSTKTVLDGQISIDEYLEEINKTYYETSISS